MIVLLKPPLISVEVSSNWVGWLS